MLCLLSAVCYLTGLLEETPLMWAVRKHYYAMIQLLVHRGKTVDQSWNSFDYIYIHFFKDFFYEGIRCVYFKFLFLRMIKH
jgi:hypothetical protein